ncbi:tRNA (adenosine(37)-N6)-threonylcarbamoyltransferase complex transferase subunit TsaD [Eubacterium barkeri]|uniref:tRNA N6-adenosine threonylcarbamoyltransferase n=1 Tax=Eubacterium barkeri TaxID=1528 RepID=A0A1H3E4I9_EUBBA|nr:tRNA (adenosine(37)-N6)-threonylcarbamoyltransferase complex transferase subunit TsaD [Eubacterium barkeri]SDX73168.1 O-sialoglycoprotein endopeptidase [Eubacterium barkeri]
MNILSIETSCDETSVAIVADGRRILSNQIYSQIDIHQKYGGVVPEIASRNHVIKLPYIIEDALAEAGLTWDGIDAIAVANGPGLVGALLIGVSEAKALAYSLKKPLIGVNHIEGHIAANFLQYPELEPPLLALVTSGGHSNLIVLRDYVHFEVVGRTRDDAAGEAYDKIARVLGFPYPGGPRIDAAAKMGNPKAIDFPRVTLEKGSYDFSFSGLKSAVLNYLNGKKMKNEPVVAEDVAASFQQAVVEVLVEKALACAGEYGMDKLCLAGGVSANSALRAAMQSACDARGIALYYPDPILCTDNAAMIGSMAYYNYKAGRLGDLTLNAQPGMSIGDSPLKKKGRPQ